MSNNSEFVDKLNYIGLNFEKIPKFLLENDPVELSTINGYNDNEHRVFKYIPINEVQLLITPTNRLNDIKEKMSLAKPISEYINPSNIQEYATFLKMLNMVSEHEIDEIEKKQEILNKNIPFGIQYEKDYAWQIYYSEKNNKYVMLTTSEDYDFNPFFYVLREQLKMAKSRKKQVKYIYVPINLMNYTNEFFKKTEISDLENYLWLFTKNWPHIYEVHDKNENVKIEIIGNTNIYNTISSGYKLVIKSREEAVKLYKELKALFILQTELAFHYNFETRINEKCELEIYNGITKIDSENISNFINEEYEKVQEKIAEEKKNIVSLEKRLEELKQQSAIKDLEYIRKQKEIAMFLEYKKTFLGKIKLFIKFKKKKDSQEKENENNKNFQNIKDGSKLESKEETESIAKANYTIEDLIIIYSKLEKETTHIKNMKSDIHALELKVKNMEKKIENATKYIEEIGNHKKSIFEFWKFVNKDEMLAMDEGNIIENLDKATNLKKSFDCELDFQELGIQMDKLQRKVISKEAQDAIFLADSKVKDCINMVKTSMDINIDELRKVLNNLKEEFSRKQKILKMEDFDIFGSISDNVNKVKILANQKHRETEKDLYNILNISQNTDVEEFKLRLEKAEKLISDNIKQVKSLYDMPIYIATSNEMMIDKTGFEVYNIMPEKALEGCKVNSNKINLYKLNVTEGMPLIYYTNIMYYNNFNETLPVGMNVSDKVVIDSSEYTFIPKNMITFKVCDILMENEILDIPDIKTIMLCEYDLELKS